MADRCLWLRSEGIRLGSRVLILSGCLSFLGCGGGESSDSSAVTPPSPGDMAPRGGPGGMTPDGMSGGAPTMESSGDESDDAVAVGSAPGAGGPPGMAGGTPGMGGAPGMSGAPGMAGMGPDGGLLAGGASSGYPGAEGAEGGEEGYGGYNAAPARPARPASYAEWTKEHFEDAVRERDEAVLAAIREKVKASPDDASVAALLTSLLQVSLEAPKSNAGYPSEEGLGGYSGSAASMPPGMTPGMTPGMSSGSAPGMAPGMTPGMAPGMTPGAAPGAAPGRDPSGEERGRGPGRGGPPSGALPESSAPPAGAAIDRSDRPASILGAHAQHAVATNEPSSGIDSLAAMILESSVGYVQFGGSPGVGAIRTQPGAAGGLLGGQQDASSYQPPPLSGESMPGAMPMTPGGAPGSYPGSGSGQSGYGQGGYGAQNGAGNMSDRKLVQEIVDGLLDNNTKEAWQTIHGLLLNKVSTSLAAHDVCEIITGRLLQRLNGTPGNVSQTLTAMVDGTAPMPAPNRAACLRMIAAASAAATDKLLGFSSVKPPVGPGNAGPGGYPGGGYPGGGYPGGGMAGMPGGGFTGIPGDGLGGPGEDTAGLTPGEEPGLGDGRFGGQGAAGGVAPSGPPLPPIELADNALSSAALFLWDAAMLEKINSQLKAPSDPMIGAEVITLGATIPHASVRQQLFQSLTAAHTAGAENLMATGLFEHNVHDPGVLVVLKSLPRSRPARNAAAQQPPDSWTLATQQLVLSLRDRLKATAKSLPAYTGAQAVRLHRNAVTEIAVAVTLPGAAKDFLGPAAPAETTMYYTRTNFTPTNAKEQEQIAEHYEDRAGGQRRADPQKGILWIDGVKSMADGTRRTMDVIIQQSATSGGGGFGNAQGFSGAGEIGGGGGSGVSYSIEVIVVETADPKEQQTTAVSATTTGSNTK